MKKIKEFIHNLIWSIYNFKLVVSIYRIKFKFGSNVIYDYLLFIHNNGKLPKVIKKYMLDKYPNMTQKDLDDIFLWCMMCRLTYMSVPDSYLKK